VDTVGPTPRSSAG